MAADHAGNKQEGTPMDYKTRIKNLREDHDKRQKEVADYLGTSQTMYARYERGANEMPLRHLIRCKRKIS